MQGVKGSLSEDRSTLILRFTGAPGFSLPLKAEEVGNLIDALASARSQMKPSIPFEPPNKKTYAGVREPAGFIETEGNGEGVLMHVRHPGMGWLHFGFSPKFARNLAYALLKRVGTTAAGDAGRRTN